ncbi:MAG: Manganese transport protein MntH, partial [uncultured Craurococcus sp.]
VEPAGGAAAARRFQPGRDACERAHPPCGRLAAAARRLRRARLSRRRRLHGPGQLGNRPRRRVGLRLHAALGGARLLADGDPAPGALRPDRHRHRAGPGAALPGPLPAPGQPRALGAGRGRHLRNRPRRADRHGDRPQPSLRHPAAGRGGADGVRCVADPLAAAPGRALAGGAGRRADGPRLRLLRGADGARPAGLGGGARRLPAERLDSHRREPALHRHRHPRGDGDAAQPLPPYRHRAVAGLWRGGGGAARGDPLRHHRQLGRAGAGAAGELGDPHHRGGRLPCRRADRGGGDPGGLRAADADGRHGDGGDPLRRGIAGLRAERDRHRDAGRAGGDGGLPRPPAAARGAAAGHAADRHRPGGDHHLALWRERDGGAADPLPGDPLPAAALRRDTADALRRGPAAAGRACGAALAGGAGLGLHGGDRGHEPEAALGVLRGL